MGDELSSRQQLEMFVAEHPAAAVYFSREGCSVCSVLRPKVSEYLAANFPRLALAFVDCDRAPALAAASEVFSVPTVVVYMDGRETARHCRSFSLGQLAESIERPYHLLFGS